jgi:hypothetical protein
MTTVAIACPTSVYALLFSCLRGREGTRCKSGIARIECSNTQQRKHSEEEGDDGKRPLAAFHGSALFRSKNTTSLDRRRKHDIAMKITLSHGLPQRLMPAPTCEAITTGNYDRRNGVQASFAQQQFSGPTCRNGSGASFSPHLCTAVITAALPVALSAAISTGPRGYAALGAPEVPHREVPDYLTL